MARGLVVLQVLLLILWGLISLHEGVDVGIGADDHDRLTVDVVLLSAAIPTMRHLIDEFNIPNRITVIYVGAATSVIPRRVPCKLKYWHHGQAYTRLNIESTRKYLRGRDTRSPISSTKLRPAYGCQCRALQRQEPETFDRVRGQFPETS